MVHVAAGIDREAQFQEWSKKPAPAEQNRCDQTVGAIKKAIESSTYLHGRNVDVFPQGSYANRTNVREDSDVDVCVLCKDTFTPKYYHGITSEEIGCAPATYLFPEYKADVDAALKDYFGASDVQRGNKAFHINEKIYGVNADIVPCFEHRLYFRDSNGMPDHYSGTALCTDDGKKRITNFPRQQYKEGVEKNARTRKQFKQAVRIVKNIRNTMNDAGATASKPIPSFLIESLIWNASDDCFTSPPFKPTIEHLLAYLYRKTSDDASCATWTEENGIKLLFGDHQEWNRQQTNDFLHTAWWCIQI